MPKKKGFDEEKYQEVIFNLLSKYPFMSTSEICDKLNMGYETGLKYLNQLAKKGRVELREIGTKKFWYK